MDLYEKEPMKDFSYDEFCKKIIKIFHRLNLIDLKSLKIKHLIKGIIVSYYIRGIFSSFKYEKTGFLLK